MGGPLTGATSEISLCMPPTCSRLYRKNEMSNFCIYAGLVGIFFSAAQSLRLVFGIAARGMHLSRWQRPLRSCSV